MIRYATLLITVFSTAALASQDAFIQCSKVSNNAERLNCYDKAVSNLTPQTSADNFGLEHKTHLLETQSITATIAKLTKTPFGKYIITLDDQQVWQQTDSTRMSLSLGDEVVIKKGALSSHYLSLTDSSKSFRVKRVQ